MSQRAIVVFPVAEEIAAVERLRRHHDPLAAFIDAHITLVFPFASAQTAADLRAHVEQAAERSVAFSAQFAGISEVDGEYVFLNVARGTEAFVELHDHLYAGPLVSFLSAKHIYRPHITVGRIADLAGRSEALATISGERLSFDAVIREVAVVRVDPGDRAEVEFTVALPQPLAETFAAP